MEDATCLMNLLPLRIERRSVIYVLLLGCATLTASARMGAQGPALNQTLEASNANRLYQASRIRDLVPQARAAEGEYRRLMGRGSSGGKEPAPGSRIADGRASVQRLQAEKAQALADLKNGFFCNRCGRSRTQLGGDAAFRAHLVDVKGEAIPATQAQIDAAMREYDMRISAIQTQLQSDEQSAFRADARRLELSSQIDGLRNVWAAATLAECYQHTQAWERERQTTQQKIDTLIPQLAALRKSQAEAPTAEAKSNLNSSINALDRQINSLQSDLVYRRGVYASRLSSFRNEADAQRRGLQSLVATLSDDFNFTGSALAGSWGYGYQALFPYDLSTVAGVPAGTVYLPGVSSPKQAPSSPGDIKKLLEGSKSKP